MTTRLVLLLAPGLLLCVCASVSSAGTSVPFRGEFKRDIETTFLAKAGPPPVVSRQKVSVYRDYLARKLRFLKDHIERHDIVDEGKSRKAAREEARTADITIALEHALELLEILEQTDSARDPGEIYDLGGTILMIDFGTRGYTDPLATLKLPIHLVNMVLEWSIPNKSRARRAKREAGNLVNPATGAFYTSDELAALIRQGRDLSTLEPPRETRFWRAKDDISKVDITRNYLEGGHPIYAGFVHTLPPYDGAVFEYRKAHKTQSKPKLDVYYLTPECRALKPKKRRKCREKFKLKFGMETHADPIGNALMAALGYNVDVSVHIRRLRINLGDHSYEDLAADWIGYFDRQRVHTYIPLESVIIERGEDEDGEYVVFSEGNAEVKPRGITRIAFFPWSWGMAAEAREARGLGIFNAWIANADMKDEENNKISLRPDENGEQRVYFTQQDIGHSMGYVLPERPNAFPWDLVETSALERLLGRMRGRIELNYVNLQQAGLEKVPTYADAKWMTRQIAQLTRAQIEEAVALGHYPGGIGPLYVEKLIHRRNQLVQVFTLEDELPLLPVDRHITTADGTVVDGELVQTRFEESSIEYGKHWRDVLGPAASFLWTMTKQLFQTGVGAVDAIIPPNVEISGNFAFSPDVLFNVARNVHLNPEPEGAFDQYIVEDTMTVGFRPRFGYIGHVEATLYTTTTLAYPEATHKAAVDGRNRVLPLLLPYEVWRGKLPEKYVLFREKGYKQGGRLRTDDAGLFNPVGIDAASSWVVSERSVLDRRDETPLLWLDNPRYLESELRGYLKASVVEIQVGTERNTVGAVKGELRVLDPARLDLLGDNGVPIFDDVVRRGDVGDVARIQSGPTRKLSSEFRSRDGRWNLFFALWRNRARQDRFTIADDLRGPPRREVHTERRRRFRWTFLDNGETLEFAVRGFLNPPGHEGPIAVVDFAVDDRNAHNDEFDRYYEFLNGLGAGRDLMAPGFRAQDWEVSAEPSGSWTRLLAYGSVHLYAEAIRRLLHVDETRYWTHMAANAGVDPTALRRYREDQRSSSFKTRMLARGSRFGRKVHPFVSRSFRSLAALREARRADAEEERIGLVVKALASSNWRSRGAFEPGLMASLLQSIDFDELLESGQLVVAGRITKPFEDELNLPERRDLVGRLGKAEPYAETRYPLFPFDGVELYHMLDWARGKTSPASPAFDPHPPVR
ncbi:MAG: hypothetical protein O7G30_18120 [Proteobacteria bacterium]|nr:hypothetical protein [Pseudomonadota bacterium]